MNKTIALTVLCTAILLMLPACSNSEQVDKSSASYRQGYEDGEKAGKEGTIDDLSSSPDKYDMIRKEDVMDYVYDNYDRESLISWYDTKSKSEASQPSESPIDWNAVKKQAAEKDSQTPSRGEIAGKQEREDYTKANGG